MKDDLCPEDQLVLLKQEHRKLDSQIRKLEIRPSHLAEMQIRKMKRDKLRLKDRIERLQKRNELLQKQ